MVRNDIKKSSLLRTKVLIYAFNGRTFFIGKGVLHSQSETLSYYFVIIY